jgi:raffinose/stachyose/melibiose transport system substrate-binding protein
MKILKAIPFSTRLLVALAILSIVTSACASQPAATATTAPQATSAPAATNAPASSNGAGSLSGTVNVFDWTYLQTNAGKKLISDYEGMHPGVKINIVPAPPGDPIAWINTRMAAGDAPEITFPGNIQEIWTDEARGKNWWMDLTKYAEAPNPYVQGNTRWLDTQDPSAYATIVGSDKKVYLMTTNGFDVAIYYNKNIFQQVGVQPPTTWAEFMDIQQKIKAAGFIPFVFPLGDTSFGDWPPRSIGIIENMVMDNVIKKLDTDNSGLVDLKELVTGIKNGTYSASDPSYQEAWKLFKDWSQYWQPGPAATTGVTNQPGNTAYIPFITGKAAMYMDGSYAISTLNGDTQRNFDYGYFRFPQITPASSQYATAGEKGVGIFGPCCGYIFSVPQSLSKNPDLLKTTIDFIYYATTPDNASLLAADAGMVPISIGAKMDTDQKFFAYNIAHPARLTLAETALPPEFEATRMTLLQDYITGNKTLDQVMTEMQQDMNNAADEVIQLYGWTDIK